MLSSILGCAQLISVASAKLLDNNPFECGTSALRSLRTCLRRHPRSPRRFCRWKRSGEATQGGQAWITGILRLVKAASLLQCPFDDKKDALVTKHLQGGVL